MTWNESSIVVRCCVLWTLSAVVAGCIGSETTTTMTPVAKAPPVDATPPSDGIKTEGGRAKLLGGLWFTIPNEWEQGDANFALLAEFQVPGPAGPARLTMSMASGGIEANLERWQGQFQRGTDDAEPVETNIMVAGKNAKMLELNGTFKDSFRNKPAAPHTQLLGVAIPIDGPEIYFVKLTGPRETVSAAREAWLKMLESARVE